MAGVAERQNRGWKNYLIKSDPDQQCQKSNAAKLWVRAVKAGGFDNTVDTCSPSRECLPPRPTSQGEAGSFGALDNDYKGLCFSGKIWTPFPTSCDAGQGGSSRLAAPQSQRRTIHTLTTFLTFTFFVWFLISLISFTIFILIVLFAFCSFSDF